MQAILVTEGSRPYDRFMQTGRPSKQPRTAFGARLHAAREALGLSQTQVAEKMGVSQKAYAVWERHPVALRPDQIERLAKILGIPIEELFGVSTPKTRGGPVGKARRVFEAVSKLPRHHQQRIIGVVEALVAQSSTER
jgi:transcriptional regulator with XRE-family HTH domain